MNSMDQSLTICSVSYESAEFLRLNKNITNKMNPSALVQWIVAENSPKASSMRLSFEERGMTILQGADENLPPTYQHTLALKSCLDAADSRFLAVIDPDLFIIRKNWVRDVIEHMTENNIAILGVPWHPKSKGKYRYFPAVHFCVFDTKHFSKSLIDFRPDFDFTGQSSVETEDTRSRENYFFKSQAASWLSLLPLLKHRRMFYTDTGSRLYKRWVDSKLLRYEILDPVWNPDIERAKLSLCGKILQKLLPDELCYIPKGYSDKYHDGFLNEALLEEVSEDWEQFMWQGTPFCFHVRLNRRRKFRDKHSEAELASRVIGELL